MFDRIDRVFMHPRLAALCANVTMESFVRYPTHISSDVVAVRCSVEAREALREWVFKSQVGDDLSRTLIPDVYSFLRHVYPSPNAPSDHPPFAISFPLPVNIFASAVEVLTYWFGPLHRSIHISEIIVPPPSLDCLKERVGVWFSRASASFDEVQHMSDRSLLIWYELQLLACFSRKEWAGSNGKAERVSPLYFQRNSLRLPV